MPVYDVDVRTVSGIVKEVEPITPTTCAAVAAAGAPEVEAYTKPPIPAPSKAEAELKYGIKMGIDWQGNYTQDFEVTDPKKYMLFQIKYSK